MNPSWPNPDNIGYFSYSKRSHFELFKGLSFKSYNSGDPDPAICDLKVYQDYLMYCFIEARVPKHSKILEVGGGDSRVLKFISKDYECWNVDKCEGLGNGPLQFKSDDYRIVYDYLGSESREIPGRYFDFIFSISALEHTPDDEGVRNGIVSDLKRVIKPGGKQFHLFDITLKEEHLWQNKLIHTFFDVFPVRTLPVTKALLHADPDTYFMARAAYDHAWARLTKQSYDECGWPLSLNLFWEHA